MEAIVTKFINYIQGNEQTSCDACSHAQYVDARKKLSFTNGTNRDGEIVFKHGRLFIFARRLQSSKPNKGTSLLCPASEIACKKV
jgi:hypothetical protein